LQETFDKNKELLQKNEFLDNFVFMTAHDREVSVVNLKQLVQIVNVETDPEKRNDSSN
jgi:hypothetical protein